MTVANLIFPDQDWFLPAVVALGLAAGLLFWEYRARGLPGPFRAVAMGLKMLGIFLLAFCLIGPVWSHQQAKPGANYLAFLADNSQGMRIRDPNATQSRGAQVKDWLTDPAAKWRARLEGHFQLRQYSFDTQLRYVRRYDALNFDGRASSLKGALGALGERFEGQPLAGILLFSDGNATDIEGELPDLSRLPPIYPVVVGQDRAPKDVALTKVTVSQTAFEDAPVAMRAQVAAPGYEGEKAHVAVTDMTGKVVAEKEKGIPARGERATTFRFQIAPQARGIRFYRLRAYPAKLQAWPKSANGASDEATLLNNERMVVVERRKEPSRILYTAGRPNWEFKFLNRAIGKDPQIRLVSLIRVAKREPKFEFKGRAGEKSNPLYRGFDKKDQTTEQYDQPVFVRLNTRDKEELQGGFPKEAEGLFQYDGVILDDLAAEFFTHDQMMLLERFVSDRGGGLLMLGGEESLARGDFADTPIGDLLPVYLDHLSDSRPRGKLRFSLTREGWLQPWARLREQRAAERERLDAMSPFRVANHVREAKPGATLVGEIVDSQGNYFPALAVQRYGYGRAAALTIGDIWRWGLKEEEAHKDMARYWRQLLRWLVADVPDQVDLNVDVTSSERVEFQVKVRDDGFQPRDDVRVEFAVRQVGSEQEAGSTSNAKSGNSGVSGEGGDPERIRFEGEPVSGEHGVFEGTFQCRESGAYRVEVVVRDWQGREIGRDEGGWTAEPQAEEFQSLRPNHPLLRSLAQRTGGRMVKPGELNDFARNLPNKKAPITVTRLAAFWHTSWLFLLALACFVAEWGLRRWRGLA